MGAFLLVGRGFIVMLLVAIAVSVAIIIVDYVAGAIMWVRDVIVRWAAISGIRAIADMSLGNDLLGDAVFEVGEGPLVESVQRIPIDASVENAAKNAAIQYNTTVIAAVYGKDAEGNAAGSSKTLLESVEAVLKDPNLMHNQYYKSDEIIAEIANLIRKESMEAPPQPLLRPASSLHM